MSRPPFEELNLALDGDDDPAAVAENHRRLLADFAPDQDGSALADMDQVHGNDVVVVTGQQRPGERPTCDALVTAEPGTTLMVRVADCVPVLLADPQAGVIGAVHAGRAGVRLGVVTATVNRMRELGGRRLQAWVGPHICADCYEVSAQLYDEVTAVVPETAATTGRGTPALDLGAGVRAQLTTAGVIATDVSVCTRETPGLYSYRRDGADAGRQAGLIRLVGAGGGPR